MLITGNTTDEHLKNLNEVLKWLEEAGLCLKREKCKFLSTSVVYLGHHIDAEGLHPTADKVDAIHQAPTPQNCSELKAYLGLLNYYNKFIPNLSTQLAPLYKLLQKAMLWYWGDKENKAFETSKQLLLSSEVLVHLIYPKR